MKKQGVKYALTVICMLAAGICYSCSGKMKQEGLDDGLLVMDLQEMETDQKTETQNGLISAETKAWEETGEKSQETSKDFSLEEGLPCQTESVRFYVHICGEVKVPGVYEMEQGSRIFQAVELAGGFTEHAAEDYLNMARETVDGMKIIVPSREEAQEELRQAAGRETSALGSAGEQVSDKSLFQDKWIQVPQSENSENNSLEETVSKQKVNLNTASKEELMTLRGIGEARASDIIQYREEYGPFQTIEEIMNISGIKDAAFQKIKDDITV